MQTSEAIQYDSDNYDVIVVENLSTKNMMRNHHLAKSIANASWGMLVALLKYKCAWYGKTLIIVDPKNTSRICFELCMNCHGHCMI